MKKILLVIFTLVFVSCASNKDVIYLLSETSVDEPYSFNELTIQKGDIIDIKVSSINPEASAIFQQNLNQTQSVQVDALKFQGYVVDSRGFINFPVFGRISVSGYKTSELANHLESRLESFVKSPVVKVRLVNYKVTVLGEVQNPGTFTFLEEQITLPQVIGTAGDLTINGDRSNISIVRKIGEKLELFKIDFTKGDLINPDYFYLQQNDLVYIPPNSARVKSAGLIGNISTLVSILSLFVGLTILITR